MYNKKVFVRFFTKLYYLDRKENKGLSINNFQKLKTNLNYEDFFNKINEFVFILGSNPLANNFVQKKRVFELFKYTVSNPWTLFIYCRKFFHVT